MEKTWSNITLDCLFGLLPHSSMTFDMMPHLRNPGNATFNAGLLNTTKIVMSAPLPRVYELGEGGKAVAVPPPPGTAGVIGGDFKGDDLTRSSKETVSMSVKARMIPLWHRTLGYDEPFQAVTIISPTS